MEFDMNKVLTPFSQDKEKWIGWKGYFSNYALDIKKNVESDSILDGLVGIRYDMKNDMVFSASTIGVYRYFYPIEPSQPKETWRPYKDLTEMIADLMDLHPKGEGFSAESLARILIGTHFLLGDYIYTPTMIDTLSDSLYMDGWVDMEDLFNGGWMFIDPETDSLKRCGIREE